MHKKSIEAAKALKEEDGDSCHDDANANSHETGKTHRHQAQVPISSSTTMVSASLDRRPPRSGRQSVDPSAGLEGNGDALRSDSIAALRAKV